MRVTFASLEILYHEYRQVFEYLSTSELQSFPQLMNNGNHIKESYEIYKNCQAKLVKSQIYKSLTNK